MPSQLEEYPHLHRWLKHHRARLNISQRDLAKLAGVSPSTISHLETARYDSVSIDLICKIAAAFDLGSDALTIPEPPSPSSVIPEEFHRALFTARRAASLSRENLAASTSIPFDRILELELGSCPPTIAEHLTLSVILDTHLPTPAIPSPPVTVRRPPGRPKKNPTPTNFTDVVSSYRTTDPDADPILDSPPVDPSNPPIAGYRYPTNPRKTPEVYRPTSSVLRYRDEKVWATEIQFEKFAELTLEGELALINDRGLRSIRYHLREDQLSETPLEDRFASDMKVLQANLIPRYEKIAESRSDGLIEARFAVVEPRSTAIEPNTRKDNPND